MLIHAAKNLLFRHECGIMLPQLGIKQHQKQGELQTMPNQPPSHRTRAKRGPPVLKRSLSRFIGSLSPGNPPATQKNETNPIYARPKYETNPIQTPASPGKPNLRTSKIPIVHDWPALRDVNLFFIYQKKSCICLRLCLICR